MDRVFSKVTRKGQITIPAELRRRHKISEGSYVGIVEKEKRIVIEPIPDLLDLAGIDAGKYSPEELRKDLERSRQRWR